MSATTTTTGKNLDTPTAVTYLRVSTREQAERGGREEGFSIPAQRAANARKAAAMGIEIVAEFVDAGESARSASRPQLQAMLAFVAEHPVGYVIVHKLDRLARNRADDVAIQLALQRAGAKLVSTTENIDETPSGMLLHGIMSSIAEFYSRNLANEVTKGMVQKASVGGTPHRAPIGYRNVTHTDDLGRTIRTVEIDPDRAPLITYAFRRYAAGDISMSSVLAEITARGLTTRPTPKREAKELSVTSLHKVLRNPYYCGVLTYQGVRYEGRHEPLVDLATWQKVQDLLTANDLAGVRQRKKPHYLRGSVYCGACGSRLMMTQARNRWGTVYPYFVCSGRTRRTTDCSRQAMDVGVVEELIEAEYRSIALSPELRDSVEVLVLEEFDRMHADTERHRADVERRVHDLKAQRAKLLEAHYAGAIPLDLLKSEQERIAAALATAESELEGASQSYEKAREVLADCLDLARDCYAAYLEADDPTRRLFNQALFTKIYIDEDGDVRVDYNPPFDLLLSRLVPARLHQELADRVTGNETKEDHQHSLVASSGSPTSVPEVQGSHKQPLVEVPGIEPGSFVGDPGLLRAQSAGCFSAPTVTQTSCRPGPATA